jgi:hypothetical protein
MAITDQQTVLILGAGVSVPFGLPLGGSLIDDLHKAITRALNILESENANFRLTSILTAAANTPEGFQKYPIHGAVAKKHLSDQNEFDHNGITSDLQSLIKLRDLLRDQTSETIDDFIVENPSFAELTKIGIAALFLNSCYTIQDGKFTPHSFEKRHHSSVDDALDRNWVHLLINIVRQGIRAKAVSSANKIKIITFNYDMILEYILDQQFSNTEAGYRNYRDYIDIIHIHGQCGELASTIKPAEMCLEWAKGINVVNEPEIPAPLGEERYRARELVINARELYFCGFSFSGPNCDLLGLKDSNIERGVRTISFCNYDGNVGVSKAARRYEISSTEVGPNTFPILTTQFEEPPATPEKPISAVDWLRLGYLGEMPG